jgi:hypothetical protein
MALTETKTIDQIAIMENGTLHVREVTKVFRDDQQIAETYHRWAFAPGSDISAMPQNVQNIANAAWTSDIVENYQNSINNGMINAN